MSRLGTQEGIKRRIRFPEDKWYLRLVKVIYIILYIPLPFVIWGVWVSNDLHSYYNSYSREWVSYGSYGETFWYCLLTLIIWMVILRLVKIAVLYIFTGIKPIWKREFQNFFQSSSALSYVKFSKF